MPHLSPTVTPSHVSHLYKVVRRDATGDCQDGPSQVRQDATQSATRDATCDGAAKRAHRLHVSIYLAASHHRDAT